MSFSEWVQNNSRWVTCGVIAVIFAFVGIVLGGYVLFLINQPQEADTLPDDFFTQPSDVPLLVDLTLTALEGETEEGLVPTFTQTLMPDAPTPTEETQPGETQAAPKPSATPTVTLSPTPSSPQFTANEDANCRTGPSTVYEPDRTVRGGETVPITGKGISPVDGASVWWQVDVSGRKCYVSTVTGVASGNLLSVIEIPAPPTPTPTETPTITPTPTETPTVTATP